VGQAPAQMWAESPAQTWAIVDANVVLSQIPAQMLQSICTLVRTKGPFPDAFRSKHVCPRQSRLGAHALQKVRRNSNHREKSILQTNNLYQSGRSGHVRPDHHANEFLKARWRQSNGESG
jgi:hypothetical protein